MKRLASWRHFLSNLFRLSGGGAKHCQRRSKSLKVRGKKNYLVTCGVGIRNSRRELSCGQRNVSVKRVIPLHVEHPVILSADDFRHPQNDFGRSPMDLYSRSTLTP